MESATLPFSQDTLSHGLLEKYNTHGPRYTSYPTAPVWNDAFGPNEYQAAIDETNASGARKTPLSLYVHIPFCESRCLYCSCNVVITRQHEQAEKYLGYLFREIERVAAGIDNNRPVRQFHWGGGTPTYLSCEQMERLFRFQTQHFSLAPDAEVAIEIDPRVTTEEQLDLLHTLGFNRISLGVQDFNPAVQEAVHRVQSVEATAAMVDTCRRLGMDSINFDLIYGLPHQSEATFARTLEDVIAIRPDRIALYNYAHVPWISPHQTQIDEQALPSGETKFGIFRLAIGRLIAAGYLYIGMDHFALPTDELAVALNEGRLHRNFMGYTVQQGTDDRGETDLIGFGVSAISMLNRYYAQNQKKLAHYYEAMDQNTLPTMRGYPLSDEDCLRRRVILDILCRGQVNYAAINAEFGMDFKHHFAEALRRLEIPAEDGLVILTDQGFSLTPLGRIFSRNMAMAFDAYYEGQLAQGQNKVFSKTL